MPKIRRQIVHSGRQVEPEPKSHYCQCNVGTEKDPKTCGLVLHRVDDWLWECRKHGEVY